MNCDSLLLARWIIPVEPEGLVLQKHALAVSAGKIIDILPKQEAKEKYQAAAVHQLDEHALIPGLVNSHTHAAMSLLRGFADDKPLMEWLHEHIWPAEQTWVGESFVADGSELAIAEMLRGGVTCFNDMYFFPEITARQAQQSGIRAAIGLILIDFPSAWAQDSNEYLAKGVALHDELRNEPLLTSVFAPHAPYSVGDAALEKMRTFAEELQCPVHIHLHETRTEIEQSVQKYGMRPLARLQNLDLLGPSLIGVHMTQLNDDEIGQIAASGCHVVHCPESNLKLASGFCPVKKLLDAGINVAIGTDSAASNNDLDILGEMKTAALLAKGVSEDASAVPAHCALRMATLNGAKALGLDKEIGSLEIGKSADITAVRLDSIETQPLFDPISQIVYAANRDKITDVWVNGRQLLKTGELTTLDTLEIRKKIAAWSEKFAQANMESKN